MCVLFLFVFEGKSVKKWSALLYLFLISSSVSLCHHEQPNPAASSSTPGIPPCAAASGRRILPARICWHHWSMRTGNNPYTHSHDPGGTGNLMLYNVMLCNAYVRTDEIINRLTVREICDVVSKKSQDEHVYIGCCRIKYVSPHRHCCVFCLMEAINRSLD